MNRERYLDCLDALEIRAPDISFTPIERIKLAAAEHALRAWVIRAAKCQSQDAIEASLNAYHTLVVLDFVKRSAYDRIRAEAYELGGFQHLNEQEA